MTTPSRLPCRDATATPPPALVPFFRALDAAKRPIPLAELERLVDGLSVRIEDLFDVARVDTAAYLRNLVFEREHVEVLVMAWLPGQRSPIHDHAGSACAVRVVSGRAREDLYRATGGDGAVRVRSRELTAGGTTSAFDRELHTLGNAVPAPAPISDILVTLHVYSPPLAPTRKYVERPAAAK